MFRLAYIVTHPIQYQAPLLRFLAASGEIDLRVFFLSDFSLRPHFERGFNHSFKWDMPLTEGYAWEVLPRWGIGPSAALRRHWPVRGLAQRLRTGGFDAVWVHGWAHIGLRQTVTAACRCGLPVLLRGDSTPEPWRPVRLKRRLRDLFCRRWFRRIAGFLCVGTRNREFYRQFGIEPQRLFWMPYTVDNAFFQGRCRQARRSREALRQSLILAAGRPVVLFAGRLVADKAPDELLTAFSTLLSAPGRLPSPYLLVVGDGPLRHGLEQQARRYGDAVRFLGFRNQTELPAFYDLCDLFVLPSRFEPWGLVVNEVMNAGKPVIVSDRVGAAPDLVEDGANGFVYPSGEVPTLTAQIAEVLECERRREEMGQRSLERIKAWGFDADRRGLIEALEFVCCRAKE